ncbi:coagulation factor XI [Rhinolophus ferrumequinum]|uniref:Coagulation factor XI n=1 Tax=Rhinolophus ferrumequinum TaxID=59479 RepID=A0A7J7ZPT4_RHIFE|nr:coagulation factor XI [Rhinolophus ferrumequinum]
MALSPRMLRSAKRETLMTCTVTFSHTNELVSKHKVLLSKPRTLDYAMESKMGIHFFFHQRCQNLFLTPETFL